MKKSLLISLSLLLPLTYCFGQHIALDLPDSSQFYFGPYEGRAMMYATCYEWNAVHIVKEKYRLQFWEKFAGCIPTEGTRETLNRMNQHNELLNQQFQLAGILPAGGTVDDLVEQEVKRQKQIEEIMRKQVFFQEKTEKGQQPVYIQSIALQESKQYMVNLFQEDRRGEMWRFMKIKVDLDSSEIKLLDTEPRKMAYPWTCWSPDIRRFEPPCSIVKVSPGYQSDCDPLTNTYSQELIIDHRVDLQRGYPIQVQGKKILIDDEPGPQKVLLENLLADGKPVDISITADRDTKNESCKTPFASVFVAPKACKNKEMEVRAAPGMSLPAPEVNPSLEVFPNPTNDQTVLRLQLDSTSKIRIAIFNLNGQLIRSVFEGDVEKGMHEWNWDGGFETGRKAPAGIYIVRLQTGQGKILTKRLTKAY